MVFSMLKFNLVLILLFLNVNAYAADYYELIDNSFPELRKVTEVYMGDAMLFQKYVYSEQCYTPKKSITLSKEDAVVKNEPVKKGVCLKSSKTIEKKSRKGIRQIMEGGTMCSTDQDEKYFYPKDFYSFREVDGSEHKDFSFLVWRKRGKVTIWQQPSNDKMIKMTDEEFEETFTRFDFFEQLPAPAPWKTVVKFKKGMKICKPIQYKNSGRFFNVDVSITKNLPTETLKKTPSAVYIVPSEVGVDVNLTTVLGDDFSYNNKYEKYITYEGNKTWNFSKAEFENSFEESSNLVQEENSMQRTIEYAGVNGNLVKFIYSEFKNGVARDAFTREFTIDLSVDSVAAFKGAVFEVIKATNSTIEYKVIRNFPVKR